MAMKTKLTGHKGREGNRESLCSRPRSGAPMAGGNRPRLFCDWGGADALWSDPVGSREHL